MSDVRDNSALKWIKGELDSTIDSARHALEGYMEGDGGGQLIDSCVTILHQVYGTLNMVQLFGAAMLAEEMELVAKALQEGDIQKRDEAAEALMLGLVQLPAYLEKLEFGARDTPLFLLPVLNELRAVLGAPLLSEVALFAPELEHNLALGSISGKANSSLSKLARKLRHPYHKVLLGLYRNRDAVDCLQDISEIFGRLEAGSGTEQVKRLFTIGKVVAVAMAEGEIEIGIATKLLLGSIDQEIKRIIENGEQAVAESPDSGLLKNLLYYIACADGGNNPLISQVKADYGLENAIVSQSDLEQQRGQFEGPSQGLLESLRSAISADLTVIKDGLDLFIRNERDDLDRLFSLAPSMHKLADTFGMVGQGGLRQRLKCQADRIDEIKSTSATPSEQDLMAIAGDILFVEASLENLSVSGNQPLVRGDETLFTELPAGEYDRLVSAVMHEASIEIARIKDAIVEYVGSPQESALIADVPARFSHVAGAFRILDLRDGAGLLDALAAYVRQELLEKQWWQPKRRWIHLPI